MISETQHRALVRAFESGYGRELMPEEIKQVHAWANKILSQVSLLVSLFDGEASAVFYPSENEPRVRMARVESPMRDVLKE